MNISVHFMGAQYFTSAPLIYKGVPVISCCAPVKRNLFLEFPDNVV